jgi:hypothetical protein
MTNKSILLFILISLSTLQFYGMEPQNSNAPQSSQLSIINNKPSSLKRVSETDLPPTTLEKKIKTDNATAISSSEKQQDLRPTTFDQIKKTINNFDPIKLDTILTTDEITQLSKEQKEELYAHAKQQRQHIKNLNIIGYEIINKTDNEKIKEKFSFDSEYGDAQQISRRLYALKTLPKLTFPQAFFTNAQQYRTTTHNPTPDQALLALIKNEQEKISICCFRFDLFDIAKKLIKKHKKGVEITLVTDQGQGQSNLQAINLLVNNGIPVLAPQNDKWETNHHKFSIFKRNLLNKTVLCHGSFNYTNNAIQRNWEDMTISDDLHMIAQFEQQFQDVKQYSSKPIFLENIKK